MRTNFTILAILVCLTATAASQESDSTDREGLYVVHLRENWVNDTILITDSAHGRIVSLSRSKLAMSRSVLLTIFDVNGMVVYEQETSEFSFSKLKRNIYYFRFDGDKGNELMFQVHGF